MEEKGDDDIAFGRDSHPVTMFQGVLQQGGLAGFGCPLIQSNGLLLVLDVQLTNFLPEACTRSIHRVVNVEGPISYFWIGQGLKACLSWIHPFDPGL